MWNQNETDGKQGRKIKIKTGKNNEKGKKKGVEGLRKLEESKIKDKTKKKTEKNQKTKSESK